LLTGLLAMSNAAVLDGQVWRLVTYGFTTHGLLNSAMVALILWFAGRPLEDRLGSWRFLILYALSGFGGATLLFVVGPLGAGGVGASAAVIGLLAANGVVKQHRGEDIRPDIGLLVILVLLNFVAGWGGLGWVAQVGGVLIGALAGIALVHAPRERRSMSQTIGLVAVAAICVAAVAVKMILV
jgi:membrane associated rhomboid family serine protease